MARGLISLFVVSVLTTSVSTSTNVGRIQILEVGQFHGDEVHSKTGESWFGLYQDTDGYKLKRFKINVSRVHDPIVDDEGEFTGKEIKVSAQQEPVLLIRGADWLRGRSVLTVFQGTEGITENYNSGFSLGSRNYTLRRSSEKKSGKTVSRLILSIEDDEQTIEELGRSIDPNWRILWAGDLDGDKKLDLYLDASAHYNVSERVLFLSSAAKDGDLVAKVAIFRTVGC